MKSLLLGIGGRKCYHLSGQFVLMAECLCKFLDDHEDWEEPYDNLDEASPEFKKKLDAANSLMEVPNGPRSFDTKIVYCPVCGTLYRYESYLFHFGDRDGLAVDRFTKEQAEILRPLLESEDEKVLLTGLEKAFSHPDKKVGELAWTIYEYVLNWRSELTPVLIRVLAKLAEQPSSEARRLANTYLYGLASSGKMKEVAEALKDKELDVNDYLVNELLTKVKDPRAKKTKKKR